MSNDAKTRGSRPGWRMDAQTGTRRWWDGARWTDYAPPPPPVVYAAGARSASSVLHGQTEPLPGNAFARAAIASITLALVAAAGATWLSAGMSPAVAATLGLLAMALAAVGLILSATGMIIAVRRPTRKGGAVAGLIGSVALVGWLVAQALAVGAGEVPALQREIGAWMLESGTVAQVICPPAPPQESGAVFACTAVVEDGPDRIVEVTVQEDGTQTWRLVG